MPNRSKKRWLDIQLILASIAVTSTVALWNNFARGARAAEVPAAPPPPDPTFTSPTHPPRLRPPLLCQPQPCRRLQIRMA